MENEERLPKELQEPLRHLKSEVERGNALMAHFFENGQRNDLEVLIEWMSNQFLKPILYGLKEETSRSRLEIYLARLQKDSARLREALPEATAPNNRKFVERWNKEMDTAISSIQERLKKLDDSTP